jgi:hypothetical protein
MTTITLDSFLFYYIKENKKIKSDSELNLKLINF